MSRSDPLLMLADIARVAFENPDLDEELIAALYQHLVLIERRQPTIDGLRGYVDRVSSLDQDELRQRLGLGRRKRGPRHVAVRKRPGPTVVSMPVEEADPEAADHRSAGRGQGRPGWTSDLFALRYQAALERATPPHTYQSVADQFEMLDGSVGTDPDHLRKLMKRYGQTPG